MKRTIPIITLSLLFVVVCFAGSTDTVEHVAIVEVSSPEPAPAMNQTKPLVQMAILLDTSGSMQGLIEQAKTELWAIVNEFIFAKRNNMAPEVQVALYEYGKDSLAAKDGYIRQIVPFTTDLDKISEELFALKTNGGQEYCGWVIQEATKSLDWSNSFDDLKVIFIAGNEPFTQGKVDYNKSCKEAIARGIIVNTIHCGSESDGLNGHWKNGAVLADGSFLNIDQNRQVAHIDAPQDKEIAELSLKLNDTYIAYGSMGGMRFNRQAQQDTNASNLSQQAAIQRSVAKSSFNYKNSDWDLVDALKDKVVKLEELEDEELPENMQEMTNEERKAYADSKAAERSEIQKRIQELNIEREKFVQAEVQKQASSQDTLGSAITKTVRQQAIKKNFAFEKPQAEVTSNPQTEGSK